MNLILQVVLGSWRYKCRGTSNSSAPSAKCTRGAEYTSGGKPTTPVLLQLFSHSLPILNLAKTKDRSVALLFFSSLVVCDEREPLHSYL